MQPCCIINHTFVCGVCVVLTQSIVARIINISMGGMLILLPRCPSLLSLVKCHSVGMFHLFAIVGFGLGVSIAATSLILR